MLQPRLAKPTDAEALNSLEQLVFASDRLSLSRIKYFINSPHNELWCIEENKNLLGYALVLYRNNSSKVRLYSLAVTPLARGRKLGKLLLQWAEQQALLRGIVCMRLEVRHDNAVAFQLYERAGYNKIHHLPAYYADGADGWRLEKSLRVN